MKGFIFAAGFGERLRPLTDDIPKSLIPVLNLPSICYSIYLLKEAGIKDVICNLHYKYKDIINFFKENDFFGVSVSFSIEETILGTGGGLKNCEKTIGEEEVVIINSDIVMDLDLAGLIDCHKRSASPATLVLRRSERADDIGRISIKEDRVVDFKNYLGTYPASDLIYTGAAVISPVIFKYLKREFSSVVYTGYVDLIRHHSISYYEHSGIWQDIGDINSYWNANITMMKEVLAMKDRISDVMNMSPEIISPASFISNCSVVRDSVIGQDAVIGGQAVVEKSVILPGTSVQDQAIIKNSVVYGDRSYSLKLVNIKER